VGDKGQVLVYNSSFERVFRSLESSPQLVFELVEASVETVVRDAVQDAYASTLPFSRQVLVSPELAWTVSSLGLKAGLAAGLEGGVFVMYSRCDCYCQHLLLHRLKSSNSSLDGGTAGLVLRSWLLLAM
jgi:hypothetical protein